jgi:hypothetical protein
MQSEKTINGTIDVCNIGNYGSNPDEYVLEATREKYVGKCFKGVYIVGIKRIDAASSCKICRSNNSGDGFVDVVFTANAVVFARWDIITGVRVVSQQKMVICEYESKETGVKAVVVVLSKHAGALAVGQTISVRVGTVTHNPMQNRVSIEGMVLTCDPGAIVYRMSGVLGHSAVSELTPLYNAITTELNLRNKIISKNRGQLWFFEKLLYSYKGTAARGIDSSDQTVSAWSGGPTWQGPGILKSDGAQQKNILEIVHRVIGGEEVPVDGLWSRSLGLYRSSPLVSVADDGKAPPEWDSPFDNNPRIVFAQYMKNIYDYLVATREMVTVYPTTTEIDEHQNVWSVMVGEQKLA